MNAPDSGPTATHRDQLQAILDNAVDAIVTIDDRGLIESANAATESLFGYTPAELKGRNINVLMPSPYHEEHDTYLANYLKTGTKKIIGVGREVVGRRKDGEIFPMHLAVSEVNIAGRRTFTGIVRDISDLKDAERRLQELNEQLEERVRQSTEELRAAQAELIKQEKLATLGQVSGGIAHEIRNPLNAVKTSAFYLMNAKNPSNEKRQEHLERIDRQVTLIDNVVTALSDVAKLPDPIRGPFSIVECLQSIASSTSMPPNISINLKTDGEIPPILVDEHQIPIVFRNLLRNARDAMPAGGNIEIRVFKNDDRVIVEVTDDGEGISPDNLQRIVEPLYSTKARGMGLGLAISKAILDKNRGRLEIESKLGRGSTFRVSLEIAPP